MTWRSHSQANLETPHERSNKPVETYHAESKSTISRKTQNAFSDEAQSIETLREHEVHRRLASIAHDERTPATLLQRLADDDFEVRKRYTTVGATEAESWVELRQAVCDSTGDDLEDGFLCVSTALSQDAEEDDDDM